MRTKRENVYWVSGMSPALNTSWFYVHQRRARGVAGTMASEGRRSASEYGLRHLLLGRFRGNVISSLPDSVSPSVKWGQQ